MLRTFSWPESLESPPHPPPLRGDISPQAGRIGRLAVEHVEAGGRNDTGREGRVQILLVDDAAARGVDEIRGRLHALQSLAGADPVSAIFIAKVVNCP